MAQHHYDQTTVQAWLDSIETDRTMVLVTGVFDLLHEEHRNFLQKAKQVGDVLMVGIEPDSRVKLLKGENRPIWNQDRRYTELDKLESVDFVFVLPEEFGEAEVREQLIARIHPDILAVSSHTPHLDKKRKMIEKYGGVLKIVLEHNPAISTSKIVEGQ